MKIIFSAVLACITLITSSLSNAAIQIAIVDVDINLNHQAFAGKSVQLMDLHAGQHCVGRDGIYFMNTLFCLQPSQGRTAGHGQAVLSSATADDLAGVQYLAIDMAPLQELPLQANWSLVAATLAQKLGANLSVHATQKQPLNLTGGTDNEEEVRLLNNLDHSGHVLVAMVGNKGENLSRRREQDANDARQNQLDWHPYLTNSSEHIFLVSGYDPNSGQNFRSFPGNNEIIQQRLVSLPDGVTVAWPKNSRTFGTAHGNAFITPKLANFFAQVLTQCRFSSLSTAQLLTNNIDHAVDDEGEAYYFGRGKWHYDNPVDAQCL